MPRFALAVAGAVLAFGPGPARATPFTLDHLLGLERFGQVALAPGETRVAFERIGPATQAGAYEYDALNLVLRSSIYLGATTGGAPGRLLDDIDGRGLVIGSWSPDDRRLLVYRLGERTFSAGIAEAESGVVRWLPGTPESALWGRSAQWRGPDDLVMILRPDADLPALMRAGFQPEERFKLLWDFTRRGDRPGRTLVAGGQFIDRNERPAESRLVLVSATTGLSRSLATGRFHDVEIAPGGRFVAAIRFTDDRAFDPSQPFLQGDFTERRELTLVDLESGDRWEPLSGADVIPHLLAWSPSGERLLVWVRQDGQGWSEGRLVQIDPRTRTVDETPLGDLKPALVQTGLRTQIVCADWLGEAPILYVESGERKDWALLTPTGPRLLTDNGPPPLATLLTVAPDHVVAQIAGDAWAIDARGSARRLGRPVRAGASLTSGLFSLGQRFQFNNAPRRDWIMVDADGGRGRVRVATGSPIGGPPGTAAPIVAMGQTVAIERRMDSHLRESLVVEDGDVLLQLNPTLADVRFAQPHAVSHQGPDGSTLVSWLYTPVQPHGGDRPPLIVTPYPGSPARSPGPIDDAVMTNVQVMVAAGYAVLIPSLPRTERQGEPALGMASDILAAVDAAERLGGFDPDRIVLWGHSFGAFAAVAAATQSDRFSAVIAANGPYDLLSVWGQFPLAQSLTPTDGLAVRSRAGWVETGQGGLGAPPYADTERYIRNSPAFAADHISAPVLLFTGDRDYVPAGQAEELFSALYRQQKGVMLITYRGEGHVLSSPANIRDMYDTVWQWLREVLRNPSEGRTLNRQASLPRS